jgi:phage terminase large subunit-like protein
MSAFTRAEIIQLARAYKEQENRELRASFAARGGLLRFVEYFWGVLEPTTPFVTGWVLEGMCEHLEACAAGEIRRLLINVPPGFMKSLLCNVFFPAWLWSAFESPHLRFLAFSYAQHLTERDNEKFRDLVRSVKFRALYGRLFDLTGEGKTKVSNNRTGWKFASSIGGVGTGERGDFVLLDDPHNVVEAESETVRDLTVRWFRESMQNRLNSLETGCIIVIMQRVHENDVSGAIVENYPEYEHFMVPMEFEGPDRRCETSIGWADPRENEGELAWPERYPDQVLEPFKKLAYLWSGQYQQRPEPRGGGIIKREYWRIWDRQAQIDNDVKPGRFPVFEYVLASFDGAYTEKEENDPSALTVWGVWSETTADQRAQPHVFGTPRVMLIDAWRKYLTLHGKAGTLVKTRGETDEEFKERQQRSWGVIEHIVATCRKHQVDHLIIENKATGIVVFQEMRRLFSNEDFTFQLVDPKRLDKVARAWAVQPLFVEGAIWRPDNVAGQMVEDELASLPRGAHDDLADTATQALNFLRRTGMAKMPDEAERGVDEKLYGRRPMKRVQYES